MLHLKIPEGQSGLGTCTVRDVKYSSTDRRRHNVVARPHFRRRFHSYNHGKVKVSETAAIVTKTYSSLTSRDMKILDFVKLSALKQPIALIEEDIFIEDGQGPE